ncbi:uncharacterized protein PG998_003382 [Apiospora kogelbergensis]|uniref:Uncharacterized protein n=1 Tax=Apiospora kogelbergensis TaxID=1337665 RepID=A0AAW0QKX9_9PEZI
MPSLVFAAPKIGEVDLAASDLVARQGGYNGPCDDNNCGAEGKDCTKTSQRWCTPYPSVKKPWQGCTCSNL